MHLLTSLPLLICAAPFPVPPLSPGAFESVPASLAGVHQLAHFLSEIVPLLD
jgi:hypothetical protein